MLDDGDRDHRHTDGELESSPMVGGLNGLSARLKQVDEEDNHPRNGVPSNGEDYFDRMSYGRTSVASDRSVHKLPGEEEEKIRREYEYKIATMQNKIAGLERDLEDADEKSRKNEDGNTRAAKFELELNEFKKVRPFIVILWCLSECVFEAGRRAC
jgi:protein SPA2